MPNNNDNEKNNTFYHKEKPKNIKKAYIDRLKSIGRKVGFASIFTELPEKGFSPKKPLFKLKEIHKKRKQKMSNISELSELYAGQRIQ